MTNQKMKKPKAVKSNARLLDSSVYPQNIVISDKTAEPQQHRIEDALKALAFSKAFRNKKVSTRALTASNTVAAPASITELARALKNDVDLIYEWVYSNVDFYPIHGLHKGDYGTLIDRVGGSFDQCKLMISLLRASAYTANYVLGVVRHSKAEVENLFGTQSATSPDIYSNILNWAQIPYAITLDGLGQVDYIDMMQMFVKVNISGTDYVFDPAFKSYNYKTGINNLGTVIGYNESTLISQAESGATITSDSVENLNRTNIRNKFKDYGTNLLDWIRNNDFDASMADIIGGRTIDPVFAGPYRRTSLPYMAPGFSTTEYEEIPNTLRASYQVNFGFTRSFFSDEIYGRRLTLTFNALNQAELKLDGVLKNTTGVLNPATQYVINFAVTHPFVSTFFDASWSQNIYGNGIYQLGNCWGPTRRSMLDAHKQIMQQNIANGGIDTDEDVAGESLESLWFLHQSQSEMVWEIHDWLGTTIHFPHHMFGITGQNDFSQSPYLDLGVGTLKFLNRDDPTAAKSSQINTAAQYVSNAFEGGVMQQSYPTIGVATPRLLDTAVGLGQVVYDATSANWNTGTNIRSQLVNWDDDLTALDSVISGGNRLIIHETGDTSVGSWVGGGFHSLKNDGVGGVIAGHILGGTCSEPLSESMLPPSVSTPLDETRTKDPIGLFTGELTYNRIDFSVGSGSFPYSLDFGRSYNSNNRFSDGPLGKGWTHNHASSLVVASNGFRGTGETSPKEAAATIAHCYVMSQLALFNGAPPDKPTLTKILIASLSSLWLIDHLTNNTVGLAASGQSREFVKLVDDSFNPQTSDAHDLIKNGDGSYTLKNPQQIAWNFSNAGKVTTFVDPAGMTVTYSYNGSGQLTSVTNGLGRTLTFTYTGTRLTGVSDGNGRSIAFSVDSNGNLTSFTDALSHSITYEYAQPGQLIKVFLPNNPSTAIVEHTYDSLGRVMTQKGADTGTSTYFFAGSRSEEVDPLENRHVMYWNEFGSMVKETNALGQTTSYEYDGLNRLVKTTLPEQNSVEVTYDTKNNVLTRTLKPKPVSSLPDIVNSFTYHSTWNKVATATDGRGKVTTNSYDSMTGRLLSIQQPQVGGLTPTWTFTYNSRGQLLTATDPTNIVTKNTFDTTTEKLLSTVFDFGSSPHLNLTASFGYNSAGDVTSITDPRGNTTTLTKDAERRLTQRVEASPFGFVTNFGYDTNNQSTSTQRQTSDPLNPWQTVSRAYTVSGMVDSTVDPASNVIDYSYDSLNRLLKIIDPENRSVEYAYDALNRVSTIKDPALLTGLTRTYSANGRSATVKDTKNNVTSYEYDGFDRLDKRIYPDATFEQNLEYDANSNVTKFLNRAGQLITMSYDDLNRMSTKTPASMPTQTMTYNLAGRVTKISTPVVSGDPTSGDFEFFFDTAGRLIQQKKPDAKTVTYVLDANGNRTRLTYPDGYFVDYVFDELNRLTDIKLNGSTTAAAHFDYNALSNRTKLTYANGCTVDYGYELDDDMSSMVHTFVGSNVSFGYSFDTIHQVKDLLVSDTQFMWDPLADATTNYAAANNLNQYPTVGGASFSYNGNGCLTGDGTWTYGYDTLSRLTSAIMTGVSASFLYDPMNRQGEKNIGGTKTRFVYDGLRRVADYDGSGTLLNRFIYGTGLDEVLMQVSNAGVITSFHQDRQSSLIASTDASGAVLTSHGYGPFGEASSVTGVPVGYTGQRFDSETGLYYSKSRYYAPTLGRFLQPDPIGYAGGLHLYAYTGNSPVTLSDPLGLSPHTFGPAPEPKEGTVPAASGSMMSPPAVGATDPGAPMIIPTIFIEPGQTGGGSGGSGAAGGGMASANASGMKPSDPTAGTATSGGTGVTTYTWTSDLKPLITIHGPVPVNSSSAGASTPVGSTVNTGVPVGGGGGLGGFDLTTLFPSGPGSIPILPTSGVDPTSLFPTGHGPIPVPPADPATQTPVPAFTDPGRQQTNGTQQTQLFPDFMRFMNDPFAPIIKELNNVGSDPAMTQP